MTQGHPHAKLAQQFWAEMEKDAGACKNWQFRSPLTSDGWTNITTTIPVFHYGLEYRRYAEIARMIRIGERWVPEPMREPPLRGTVYYAVSPHRPTPT